MRPGLRPGSSSNLITSMPLLQVLIVLLSGMAADERLFAPQVAAFPTLCVQPWIAPRPGKSGRQYAARLAPRANPGRQWTPNGDDKPTKRR
jgi:hypothetical protein